MKKPILWVLLALVVIAAARLAVRRRELCGTCGRARAACCGEHRAPEETTPNAA